MVSSCPSFQNSISPQPGLVLNRGFSLFGGNKREMGHQKIPVCSPMLGRWPGLCVAAGQPLRLSLRQLLFSVRFAEGSWPGVAFLYGRFCHLSILELSWFFLMSLSPPHWIIFARKFYSRGGVAVPPFSGANRQDGVKFVWNIWAPYASGAWPHSVAGGADACGSSNGHAASLAGGCSSTGMQGPCDMQIKTAKSQQPD